MSDHLDDKASSEHVEALDKHSTAHHHEGLMPPRDELTSTEPPGWKVRIVASVAV